MSDAASFGAWLKQRRTTCALTQAALAQRLGCSTETISKLERGERHPSRALTERLADVLNVVPEHRAELLGLTRSQPRPAPTSGLHVGTGVPGPPVQASEPTPFLATKLYRPRLRAAVVARPRLLARLDMGLAGRLTLIAAPAGFGKTTLLTEWLSQQEHGGTVAWLTLDAGDADPLLFLRYLVAALHTLAPTVGHSVLALLGSGQAPPLETLIALLLNDLVTLPEPSLLVLDDYHVIDAPAVHQALTFLLDHLPPQLHLVIATRVDPPLPLARLRARGQLTELRAHDLQFTPEEAATFLTEVMGVPLSVEEVAVLEARTEGWIAGLQLAALSLRDRPTEQRTAFIDAFAGSHHFVVDYLVEEVLARQPAQIQSFLLRTSILERLSGPLCDAVVHDDASAGVPDKKSERASSQALLERLERANLFLVPLDEARHWYRYHQLFAQVLRERLARSTSPAAIATLHERAAAWYEQHGLVTEAIHHALAAQDFERAGRLLEQSVEPLWMRGELRTLQRSLQALPTHVIRTAPHLLLASAWAQFLVEPYQIDAVEAILHDVEAVLAHGTDDTAPQVAELRGRLAAIRAAVASNQEDIPGTIALAHQALAYLSEDNLFWCIIPLISLGLAHDAAGDVAAASRAFADAIKLCQVAGNTYAGMIATMHLARVHGTQGQLHSAADLFQQALDIAAQQGWRQLPMLGLPHVWLGKLLYEWNDLEQAARHLLDGITLVGARGQPRVLLEGYATLARVKQAQGDVAGAGEMMRHADQVAQAINMTWAAPLVSAYKTRLWLAQGQVARAAQWLEASRQPLHHALTVQSELEQVTLARVLLAQGKPAEALPVLERCLQAAEAAGRLASVIELLALQAVALQCQGKLDQAITVLRRALTLAAPEGYVRVFVDEGAPMAALLRQADARGIAPGYITTFLAAFPTVGEGTPTDVTARPTAEPGHAARSRQHGTPAEPLSARELEVLRLLAAGRSNQEIADKLVVAVGTVKRHINSILGKLHAHSRLEAVARAREFHLL